MRLKCISTGSSGNCYLLKSNDNECLFLDLGTDEKSIKVATNFDIKSIVGACVTHSHLWLDHSKSVKNLEKIGIKVFHPYTANCEHMQTFSGIFGKYKVTAFALDDTDCKVWQHTNTDGSECPIYGFYVQHPELEGGLIYATDCKYIKFNFAKQRPSVIILGVDYQADMLDTESIKYRHVLEGHLGIEAACDFIKANNNDRLRNVVLGHLSSDSSSDEYFINEVRNVYQNDLYIAKKDIEINLDSCPF